MNGSYQELLATSVPESSLKNEILDVLGPISQGGTDSRPSARCGPPDHCTDVRLGPDQSLCVITERDQMTGEYYTYNTKTFRPLLLSLAQPGWAPSKLSGAAQEFVPSQGLSHSLPFVSSHVNSGYSANLEHRNEAKASTTRSDMPSNARSLNSRSGFFDSFNALALNHLPHLTYSQPRPDQDEQSTERASVVFDGYDRLAVLQAYLRKHQPGQLGNTEAKITEANNVEAKQKVERASVVFDSFSRLGVLQEYCRKRESRQSRNTQANVTEAKKLEPKDAEAKTAKSKSTDKPKRTRQNKFRPRQVSRKRQSRASSKERE